MSEQDADDAARAYFAAAKRKNIIIYIVAVVVLLTAGTLTVIIYNIGVVRADHFSTRALMGGVALIIGGLGMAYSAYRTAKKPLADSHLHSSR